MPFRFGCGSVQYLPRADLPRIDPSCAVPSCFRLSLLLPVNSGSRSVFFDRADRARKAVISKTLCPPKVR